MILQRTTTEAVSVLPRNPRSILKLSTQTLMITCASVAASITALIKTFSKVVSLCVEHSSHIKIARKNTDRLYLQVEAFISVGRLQ